ncbi:roadblock/LC7 domain-containing protein [Planosporangium sp. 12N6]|uniref:roadblock/LC7 domain-containing protein n=1 Tax=Planosporangium spinosum TaxID=3402278 RepID=UPI003CEE6B8A
MDVIHTPPPESAADHFNWLLTRFTAEAAGVLEAIAVSSDGLLIGMSALRPRAEADRLAAITSAIISLADGASQVFDLGGANKIIIDLDDGYVLVRAINPGSAMGVLARKDVDLGGTAYEMTLFARRTGEFLTPQLIEELKRTIGP